MIQAVRGAEFRQIPLGQLRYDVAKLRAKRLVLKVPKTDLQTHAAGLRIRVLFLYSFSPCVAATLRPVAHDDKLPPRAAHLRNLCTALSIAP